MKAIQNVFALTNISDLTTPSSTQAYQLGTIITVYDSDTKTANRYMYVKSHGALTAYQPYVLGFGGTAGSEIVTAAPATIATANVKVVIPQVDVTSGYYCFVLYSGVGKVLMTAETYAAGDYLELLNTGTAFVVDGTTGSTSHTAKGVAVCKESGSTAVARSVLLIDKQALVSAS